MIKTTSDNKIKRVLWTGGLDSTYRMIELALQDVIVEPVYVVNPVRRSRNIELATMNTMLELLRGGRESSEIGESELVNDERCAGESSLNNVKRFKADIRDIRMFNRDDIVIPDNIHTAYERLHASHDIGPQYEWLSALSKTVSGLEICIEKAPTGRLHSRDVIIEGGADADLIFGDFILPIFDITEDEMIANIRKWGCEDIIRHIWFCNHPLRGGNDGTRSENKEQGDANALRCENDALCGELNGVSQDVNALCGGLEPCGICHPCRIKAEAGMVELLPRSALGRYRQMRAIEDALGEDAAREYRMKVWVEFGIK